MKLLISILALMLLFAVAASAAQTKDIERYDFVHKAKSNGGGSAKAATCYGLMGVKWTSAPVNYAINLANPDGLDEAFVTTALTASAEAWDSATSKELFSSPSIDPTAVYGVYDAKNSVVFGDYPDNNAIAVTSIWYNKRTKQILEFDMILNTRFAWGDATVNPSVMDVQNIATHEFGHSVGLKDLYTSTCTAVTMYGYSSYGETSKISLEQPDITGLQSMYGQ